MPATLPHELQAPTTGPPEWLVHVCKTGFYDPSHRCGTPATAHGCVAWCRINLTHDHYQPPDLAAGQQACTMCLTALTAAGWRRKEPSPHA